ASKSKAAADAQALAVPAAAAEPSGLLQPKAVSHEVFRSVKVYLENFSCKE
ncbi:hypothetical protein HK102_011663, partial [Quaeritorhiza haematococci]